MRAPRRRLRFDFIHCRAAAGQSGYSSIAGLTVETEGGGSIRLRLEQEKPALSSRLGVEASAGSVSQLAEETTDGGVGAQVITGGRVGQSNPNRIGGRRQRAKNVFVRPVVSDGQDECGS